MAKRKSPFKDIPNGSLKIVREAGGNTLRATWSQCKPATVKGEYKEGKHKKKGVCYKFKQYTVQWWVRYVENDKNSGWVRASETPASITERSNLPGGKVTSTFSYPDNAYSVRCDVKAKYETVHKCTSLSLPSFATRTSGELVIRKADVPSAPSQPSISVDRDNNVKVSVTFSTDEITTGTDSCKIEVKESIIKNGSVDGYKNFYSGGKATAKISFSKATITFIGTAGKHYLVRVAGYNSSSKKTGTWSDWSDKIYTNPSAPKNLLVVADAQSSAKVTFDVDGYTDSYDVEYATETKYLGFENEFRHIVSHNEDNKEALSHAVTMIVTNLEAGNTYYFRARSKRSSGESYETSWAPTTPVKLSIGRVPGPPTTYSSKTAAEIGDTVNLYWVHNSQDGSSQTYAELEIYVNNTTIPIHKDKLIIKNPNWDDEYERDKTSVHPVELKEDGIYYSNNNVAKTYDFKDGDIMFWRVRTRGVYEAGEEKITERYELETPSSAGDVTITLQSEPLYLDTGRLVLAVKSSETDNEFIVLSRGVNAGTYSVNNDNPRIIAVHAGSGTLVPLNETVTFSIMYSYSGGFGAWSAMKQITMYEKPQAYIMLKTGWEWDPLNLEDNVTPIEDLPVVTNINRYPFAIIMGSRPESQRVISYNLTIKNVGGEYPVTDIYGQERYVAVGEVLYQNYFDTRSDDDTPNQRTVIFYPSDVVLENGQTYEFKVDVYTVAGLTDDDSVTIPVVLEDQNEFDIMASVEVDTDNITANIVPYCFDIDPNDDEDPDEVEITIEDALIEEALTADVLMDVYRIETDGTLTMIKEGVPNTGETVFDQHPSLDYARYRIIARKIYTAKAEYEDFVDEEVGVHSLVIEWDDSGTVPVEGGKSNIEYNAYVDDNDPRAATRAGLGSVYSKGFLVLPWNIDTTEEFNPDVSFVEYIGRENPVSYYGTQRGQTASWSTDIDKKDTETLFKLRRLARHMGDCYVREPSGTGYWANVKVSWSQTHNEPAVPVSITVTRVEPKEDNNAEVE